MFKNYKEMLIRCMILLVGLTIAHFGVTLYLLANLGADPFNVLVQGIFRTLDSFIDHPLLTHGNTHIAISLFIIFVLLFVDRSYVKIGTVICMLFGGPIIDFFTMILTPLFEISHSIVIDVLVEVIACAILAFGMSIVIKSEAGTGPNDLVSIVLSDKLRFKFSIVRTCTDISFVVIGFVLGGLPGLGTIICAFLVGTIAGYFLPFSEKCVHKLMKNFE